MKHLTPDITSNVQPTLADVLAALDGKDLSALRRRDLASAVRRVARMAGQEPHQVPLDMKVLSAILERGPANGKVPSLRQFRLLLTKAVLRRQPPTAGTVPWRLIGEVVTGGRLRISHARREVAVHAVAPQHERNA